MNFLVCNIFKNMSIYEYVTKELDTVLYILG